MPRSNLVQMISKIGTSGKHPSNCERDMHQLLRLRGKTMDVEISGFRARLFNYKKPLTNEELANRVDDERKPYAVRWQPLYVIYPDELLCAIWTQKGEDYFRDLFLPTDAKAYWDHVQTFCPWFRSHPFYNWTGDRSKLVPLSLYGDEVAAWKASEAGSVSVVAFTTDFAVKQGPLARYFLMCVYADHTATNHTYSDLLEAVLPRLQKLVSPGESYPWTSSGYQFAWSSCQGDLKWLNEKYGIQPFRKTQFCSYCPCAKRHDDVGMTLGDFREGATHTLTRYDHAHFLATTTPEDRY